MTHPESNDQNVIIALTSPLGLTAAERNRIAPLAPAEWVKLAHWLERANLSPAVLRTMPGHVQELLSQFDADLRHRLNVLLDRHDRAMQAVHELAERGIWTATILDDAYPRRWRQRLGESSPPVVYGNGQGAKMHIPAIGIVGSRDIAPGLVHVANDLGAAAVLGGFAVTSGEARGTDRIGMDGALEVGGTVVGILPDHLQRERLRRSNRDDIAAGRLTLLSVVHPDTPFSVGNAMYRNRLIYALSEATIVVSTSGGTGGTWTGAVGNLRNRWAPIAVWTGTDAPDGNHRLVELGAFPFSNLPATRDEVRVLVTAATEHFGQSSPPAPGSPSLQLDFPMLR